MPLLFHNSTQFSSFFFGFLQLSFAAFLEMSVSSLLKNKIGRLVFFHMDRILVLAMNHTGDIAFNPISIVAHMNLDTTLGHLSHHHIHNSFLHHFDLGVSEQLAVGSNHHPDHLHTVFLLVLADLNPSFS